MLELAGVLKEAETPTELGKKNSRKAGAINILLIDLKSAVEKLGLEKAVRIKLDQAYEEGYKDAKKAS